MKGFQIQEYDLVGGIKRTGTHPKVYKTRWGARLALIWHHEWYFATFRVIPTPEPEPIVGVADVDGVLSDFESTFKATFDPLDHRQWPVVPKDPMARTFTGRVVNTGQWKCNECGFVNEWHAPTCRCHRR